MGFLLTHDGFKLKIRVEDVDRLRLHEEFIDELLKKLVSAMEEDRFLRDPVIVEEGNLIVLDGTHRVGALKKLGCSFAPVCFINDYFDPSVSVSSWHRVVKGSLSFKEVLKALKELNLTFMKASSEASLNLVKERKAVASLASKGERHIIVNPFKTIREAYEMIKLMELRLRSLGLTVSYEVEEDAEGKVARGEAIAMLATPPLLKEEVVEAALKGYLFPYKTTRHIIPARPISANIPLAWLREPGSKIEEVNDKIRKYLSGKRIVRKPLEQVVYGYRYESFLYIFT